MKPFDVPTLKTERLILRPWKPEDATLFADMNADPAVMEHFPAKLTREESDAMIERIQNHFREHGFGPWAVEVIDRLPFIGFVGLQYPRFEAHFTPCVEIGWRLSKNAWGQGYATEAARAALRFAFEQTPLEEVVAMTATTNLRSSRVMERLGMTRNPADDFDHPMLTKGHPLERHVLYRIQKSTFTDNES